jgi:hypothetical protein
MLAKMLAKILELFDQHTVQIQVPIDLKSENCPQKLIVSEMGIYDARRCGTYLLEDFWKPLWKTTSQGR